MGEGFDLLIIAEGYAVLERDESDSPVIEAYFIKGTTQIIRKGAKVTQVIKNNAPYPLLVPIIFRPDARRPFGHSRISRTCMDITSAALRTLKRAEVSAEFYSFQQKYVSLCGTTTNVCFGVCRRNRINIRRFRVPIR